MFILSMLQNEFFLRKVVMQKILVVDFGSQYNQLIVRRIREIGVYSELIAPDFKLSDIQAMIDSGELKGIILSGGPDVITNDDALKCDEGIFDLSIPVLGICYGMQFMSDHYGQSVLESEVKEYGLGNVLVDDASGILKGLDKEQTVWMSHGYHVELDDNTLVAQAHSDNDILAVIKHADKQQYGIQFHPEVTNTVNGLTMLTNFVDICGVEKTWSMKNYLNQLQKDVKGQVQDEHVILGLSGGVDSTVVAALLAKAIPGQVTCIIVNHGLMRKNEIEQVLDLIKTLDLNLVVVDAKELFLSELKDISDPETKRKIIGKLFIDTFEAEKKKLASAKFLAQGTLYTDIVESGTAHAQTIKSHHNVGGLPEDLEFELVEPLKWLFKDEVRLLGAELGLPDTIVHRQPFPGPGLAIRIMGDITEEKLFILRESDQILRDLVKKHNLDREIWQYFTVLTGVQTVGVKGDERSYEYVLAIRAISSIDGMTAKFYPIPYDILTEISTTITNNVRNINRVVYDITSKPPATIEWE